MKNPKATLVLISLFAMLTISTYAQPDEFTYQGSLNVGGQPANGNFDFEFAVFGQLSGGTQVGTTITRTNVPVVNGVFSVSLVMAAFINSPTRFLEIRVRQVGIGSYITLTPRQRLTTSPYAVMSMEASQASFALEAEVASTAGNAKNADTAQNALSLGGLLASQYLVNNDPRLPSGFIQNQNAGAQPGNFNITGNGTIGGNLAVSGNITIPVTTRFAHVRGISMSPTRSDFGFISNALRTGLTAGQFVSFEAPIFLPQGATITGLQGIVVDNDAAQNLSISVQRLDPFTAEFGESLTAATSSSLTPSPNIQTISNTTPVVNPIVNNQVYSYSVGAGWFVPAVQTNLGIYAIRVSYTISSPIP